MTKTRKEIGIHPSRTRGTAERAEARRNEDQRIARFSGSSGHRQPEAGKRKRDFSGSVLRTVKDAGPLATFVAMGLVAVSLMNARDGNGEPVDVAALPPNQVTSIKVTADGNHYPSGIAGKVINHNTELAQVTAEIKNEVEGSVVPTGTILKLPTDQIDPAAVRHYEHGQNS